MNHEIITQDEINLQIRKFETTDPAHADVFNEPIEALVNNDAYLDKKIDEMEEAVSKSVNGLGDTTDDIEKHLGINSRNLLYHGLKSSKSMGLTKTVNKDESITCTGTSTGFTSSVAQLNDITRIYITEDLILSGCPTGGSDNTYSMSVTVNTDDGERLTYKDTGNGVTIPLSEVGEYAYVTSFSITFNQGVNCGNGLTFKPMIRLASDTDDTYVAGRLDRVAKVENDITEINRNLFKTQDYKIELTQLSWVKTIAGKRYAYYSISSLNATKVLSVMLTEWSSLRETDNINICGDENKIIIASNTDEFLSTASVFVRVLYI